MYSAGERTRQLFRSRSVVCLGLSAFMPDGASRAGKEKASGRVTRPTLAFVLAREARARLRKGVLRHITTNQKGE